MFPTLKKGYDHPSLRDYVKRLQDLLNKAGYKILTDGYFGENTETVVISFQADHDLFIDGVVGGKTWKALFAAGYLPDFKGDLSWVHAREGHNGKPYWPGGESGITLDPGVDLGYMNASTVRKLYNSILTEEQLKSLDLIFGVKGQKANEALKNNSVVESIRISSEQADFIFPWAAKPYWKDIKARFPGLPNAPGCIHTALLSLSYNRGAWNKDLWVLKEPLSKSEWVNLADLIGGMQQNHKLEGIRKRRRLEAEYIRKNL